MLKLVSKKWFFLFLATFLFFAYIVPVFAKNVAQNGSSGFYRYDFSKETDNTRFKAVSPGEQFGTTISQGDFNGDGISDLLVGSPFYSNENKTWIGKVSLFYGKKNAPTGLRNLAKFPPDVVFLGENEKDQFGSAISVTDFNRDGISDLVISAYRAISNNSDKRSGKVYVIYGRDDGFPEVYDLKKKMPDITLIGNDNENNFGISVATGDFNGDDYDDIAIASLDVSINDLHGTGKVHVLFGGSYFKTPTTFDLNTQPLQMTLYGQESFDYFGATLSSGDINGDSFDDILVSSYFADNGKKKDVGQVSVFYGYQISPSMLADHAFDVHKPDVKFYGEEENDWLGFASTSDDINHDGFSDLIVSSFPFSKNKKNGKVYVIYGKNDFQSENNVDDVANLKFYGDNSTNILGGSVTTGDFNGDGDKDLLFGAPSIDKSEDSQTGKAYLFYGNFGKYNTFKLDKNHADVTFDGANSDGWFGSSVLSLDFNHDYISDVVIASMYADTSSASNTGEVYVAFGNERPLGQFNRSLRFSEDTVKRGDFAKHVIEVFGLENKKAKFLKQCKEEIDFCLFNFSAQSRFDDIRFEPNIILYPDVYPAYSNYDYVNLITMLGLMHGYMSENDSPFKPEENVTRIQALKVLLGASNLLSWKYKSDLVAEFGGLEKIKYQLSAFPDVDASQDHMWWYPRYVNYAYLTGIVPFADAFRPDDPITQSELDNMVKNILRLID